jgi:hypothetical protein
MCAAMPGRMDISRITRLHRNGEAREFPRLAGYRAPLQAAFCPQSQTWSGAFLKRALKDKRINWAPVRELRNIMAAPADVSERMVLLSGK